MTVTYLYCQFEPCAKRLIDFCFVCHENGGYYCDEMCAERDLQEKEPKVPLLQ